MHTHLEAFHEIIDAADSGFEVVPIDNAVARAVSKIPRAAVADPFDRIIAATALVRESPLVTYDHRIRPGIERTLPERPDLLIEVHGLNRGLNYTTRWPLQTCSARTHVPQ